MNPFQYVTAGTPDEAVSLVGKNGRYLAGGIDLLAEMKDYIVSPDVLVNVKEAHNEWTFGIGQIIAWETPKKPVIQKVFVGHPEALAVGALMTITEVEKFFGPKLFQGLAEAASEIGSPQIRNVATVAGNLLQHSRCWYYRQPDIVCLKRGGDMCHAANGENKYHTIFTGCPCHSPVVSNLAVILTALDARAYVQKSSGEHTVLTMPELYSAAWTNPTVHHSLNPSDLLLAVIIPNKPIRSAYRQVSEKSEFDWALVSCAAAGNVTDGKITDARVVLGAVAPVPYMVEEANNYLEGKPLTDENASKAADIILKDAKPLEHNGYKMPLAHALIRRTLLALNP